MVYNNIDESPFVFKYDDLTFYFSSNYLKEKFIKQYINFIKDETIKLKVKFKNVIMCDEMILLLLYKKVEKRGFRVYYKDHKLKELSGFNLLIDENSFID